MQGSQRRQSQQQHSMLRAQLTATATDLRRTGAREESLRVENDRLHGQVETLQLPKGEVSVPPHTASRLICCSLGIHLLDILLMIYLCLISESLLPSSSSSSSLLSSVLPVCTRAHRKRALSTNPVSHIHPVREGVQDLFAEYLRIEKLEIVTQIHAFNVSNCILCKQAPRGACLHTVLRTLNRDIGFWWARFELGCCVSNANAGGAAADTQGPPCPSPHSPYFCSGYPQQIYGAPKWNECRSAALSRPPRAGS